MPEDTHWRELRWLDGQGTFTMLFQLQVPPVIPNGQNWSKEKAFEMSLGQRERTVWKQIFTPEGLILKRCEGGHSRFLLLVSYKAHSIDWMKASKGVRGLIISVPLSVITKHPYCITSVPNISKNKFTCSCAYEAKLKT